MFSWYENYVTKEWWWFSKQRDCRTNCLPNINIPEWHNFHIKETQLNILFITYLCFLIIISYILLKKKIKRFKQSCVRIPKLFTRRRMTFRTTSSHVLLRQTMDFYSPIGCWQRYDDVTANVILSLVKYEKSDIITSEILHSWWY